MTSWERQLRAEVWVLIAALLLTLLVFTAWPAHAQTSSRVIIDHPNRYQANVADIGATMTQIVAATSGQRVYVTSLVLVSSTATAGSFALRAGTGSDCATGTTGVLPQPGVRSPTLTLVYPGNASTPLNLQFSPPLVTPQGYALCLVGVATNLARGAVLGFTAP